MITHEIAKLRSRYGGLGYDQVRPGRIDCCLFDRDLHLVRLRVEFDQHVAFLHSVVVVDQDPSHLADHTGRDEGHITVHIRVIG